MVSPAPPPPTHLFHLNHMIKNVFYSGKGQAGNGNHHKGAGSLGSQRFLP